LRSLASKELEKKKRTLEDQERQLEEITLKPSF